MNGFPTIEQNFDFSSDDEEEKERNNNAKSQLKLSTGSNENNLRSSMAKHSFGGGVRDRLDSQYEPSGGARTYSTEFVQSPR